MSKAKIAFVVPGVYAYYVYGSCPPGGAERQACLLGEALASRGDCEVHHVVTDHGQNDKEFPRDGVTLWRSFSRNDNPLRAFWRVWRTLRDIDADVYVFRSASIGVAVGMALVAWGVRRPVVYMLANEHEDSTVRTAQLFGWGNALAMALAYRLPRAICAQTEMQAASFSRKRRRAVAGVVPNACPTPHPSATDVRRTVLWVGRAIRLKRGDSFLSLARALPEYQFVMVCAPGDIAVERRWRQDAARLKQVAWTGTLAPDMLQHAYHQARLYVHTSETEGVSNTMLEALASGCPVLSASVDPNGALEKHGAGRCLHRLDDAALLKAAGDMLSRGDAAVAATGARGQAYMREMHDPNAVAEKFMGLISPFVDVKDER